MAPAPKFLLNPLISASGATVIAAMGGTGKGWYALAVSLTVATGRSAFLGHRPAEQLPVVYLDWEDDADYFAERVHAMCRPHGVDIPGPDELRYAQCDRPLGSMIDGLIRTLHHQNIGRALFVIDSRGAAVGSDINEATGTNDLYDALRRLPGPSLVVDHQSWEASRKKRDGAIGSVYGWNRPRMIWNAESAPSKDGLVLVLRNPKFNRGRRQANQAWAIDITNGDNDELEAAVMRHVPMSSVAFLGGDEDSATTGDKLHQVLAASDVAWTVAELTEATGINASTIRQALNRDPRFANVAGDQGGAGRWTALEKDTRQQLPDPM